jgi:xanthine dehydrogenase molybdopterin-binding subunit B
VKRFLSAKDIPSENDIGPVIHDEELFASKEVLFHGQPVGIIIAETHQIAVEASRAVEV